MIKKRKAQGMSVRVIIITIIGLIVLVTVIMVFSGKFSDFRSGIGKAGTCEDACKVLGYDLSFVGIIALTEEGCKSLIHGRIIPGAYSDIPKENNRLCCCTNKIR